MTKIYCGLRPTNIHTYISAKSNICKQQILDNRTYKNKYMKYKKINAEVSICSNKSEHSNTINNNGWSAYTHV